ncbi:MAG: hypothetical protein DLM65_05390 [Candidatus Aeolococcus gillhamiae]|uniref:Uncharacterized protein n=1 Tax=Candidatus Aeolococcus gillhamiae TaxID=3127015 RepID=A0A2W6AV21_9BACT|nr:MAG: hypothetical protein DLM65_05390 [Candidatus Dormibacter sp. RRmetagenome_bin12]
MPLVAIWLLVLVPQVVRHRLERRREMVESFQQSLQALARGERGGPVVACRRSPTQRRRAIFNGLLLSMALSLATAIVLPSKSTLVVHLAVDNLFLAYVGLLVRCRDSASQAATTSRPADLVVTPRVVQPILG